MHRIFSGKDDASKKAAEIEKEKQRLANLVDSPENIEAGFKAQKKENADLKGKGGVGPRLLIENEQAKAKEEAQDKFAFWERVNEIAQSISPTIFPLTAENLDDQNRKLQKNFLDMCHKNVAGHNAFTDNKNPHAQEELEKKLKDLNKCWSAFYDKRADVKLSDVAFDYTPPKPPSNK